MPSVSVIMPSYNHEKYISEAIESVINQTYTDLELIIIDDASRDNSPDIIRDYADKDSRIRALFHEQNLGISHTMNDALDMVKGDYTCLTASDDLWLLDKLEKQFEILSQDKDVIVWSDAYIIDAEGKNTGKLWTQKYKAQQKNKSGNLFIDFLWSSYVCGQSVLFKSEFASSIRYDPRLTYANDYKFMIDLSKDRQFFFISEPLVKYRIHGENAILQTGDRLDKDKFIISKYVIQKYAENLPNKLKARLYSRIGRYLLKRNKYKMSSRCFLISFRLDPFHSSHLKRLSKSRLLRLKQAVK